MNQFVSGLLEMLMVITATVNAGERASNAYCRSEYFEAECPGGVILMKSAQYGRMQSSRCVSSHKIGCSVDVMYFFDKKCSGRQSCSVYVSDPELHKQKPCHSKDYANYLEAIYECVTVVTANTEECDVYGELPIRSSSGYISSDVTVKHDPIGSKICPWILKVPKGQKIKFTLFTFGMGKKTTSDKVGKEVHHVSQACYDLGEITEYGKMEPTRISTCEAGNNREYMVYQSHSNKVQVMLLPGEDLSEFWPFLIKFEAIGCEHLTLPVGAHMEGDTKEAIVRCNDRGETWHLTCVEKEWIGDLGNCSNVKRTSVSNGSNFLNINNSKFPVGILLIVALGVALGVFLGGILLTFAAVHMRKKQRKQKAAHSEELYNTFQSYQDNNTKLNISHQPYYDIDTMTLQGEYGLHLECPTHGHKHRAPPPPTTTMQADLIPTLHQPDLHDHINTQYETTMHKNNTLKHGHLYEKTQCGSRITS